MTYVLGLNAFHADAAACLVKDGELVAAAEEERFRRIKHWAGFPSEAIRYCLKEAGIALADVDHVAVNSDNARQPLAQAGYVLTSRREPELIIERLRNRGDRADVAGNLQRALPDEKFAGTVHAVEHHLAISPRPSSSRPSTRRSRSRSTASATSPARRGAWARAATSRSTAASTSRTRSASSTRR